MTIGQGSRAAIRAAVALVVLGGSAGLSVLAIKSQGGTPNRSDFSWVAYGATAVLLLLLGCLFVFPRMILDPHGVPSSTAPDRKGENDIRQSLIQAVGILATIGTLIAGIRQFTAGNQSSAEQQFSAAVAHLGDKDSSIIRAGGARELGQLAAHAGNAHLRIDAYALLASLVLAESRNSGSPTAASSDDPVLGLQSLARRHVDVAFALTELQHPQPLADGSHVHVQLNDADLRGANLAKGDLSYADLRGARLEDTDDRAGDLINLQLHCADLRGANVRRANLYNADLRGADLRALVNDEPDAHFYGSQFDSQTKVDPSFWEVPGRRQGIKMSQGDYPCAQGR